MSDYLSHFSPDRAKGPPEIQSEILRHEQELRRVAGELGECLKDIGEALGAAYAPEAGPDAKEYLNVLQQRAERLASMGRELKETLERLREMKGLSQLGGNVVADA